MTDQSTNSIIQYFKSIQKLSQAPREEMHALWKKAKKGDHEAKKRIMEMNLRLVVPIAKKYHRADIEFLDLIEEGNLGLLHAIDKFDPGKGYRFSTYASYWIEQSIRRAVEEQSKTIRIPPHAWEALRRWLKEWDHLHGQLGRDPTLAEMAKRMHLTARQVRGVLDAAEAAKGIGSLETPLEAEENITVEDMLSESEASSPENLISVLKLHDELGEALNEIGDREKLILELRYGLTGKNPMTLEEVGKKLKLSRERIRQIEERALLRLRRVANRMGLIELAEPRAAGPTNLQPGWNVERPRFNVLGQALPQRDNRFNPFSNPSRRPGPADGKKKK
jgi:RNA polymerase primary sigma factor